MCVKSSTSLSSMDPVPSIGRLSQPFLLEERNEYRMSNTLSSKSMCSIHQQKTEHSFAELWILYQIKKITKMYSTDSFSSFQRIFRFFLTVQVDFITNSFVNVSDTMATRFATSFEWRQYHLRKFASDSSDDSWDDSSISSSSTTHEDDELSISSTSSFKLPGQDSDDDYLQTQSEELLTAASFVPTNSEGEADEWGHFMDFQEFESLSSLSIMAADPFQSLSKTFLRRRGAKVSVCKLEQLQEVDSFVTESE